MRSVQVVAPVQRRAFWQEALSFWDIEAVFSPCEASIVIWDNSDGDLPAPDIHSHKKYLLCGDLPQSVFSGTRVSRETAGARCVCPRLTVDLDGYLAGDELLFLLDFFLPKRYRIQCTGERVLALSAPYAYSPADCKLNERADSDVFPMVIARDNILYTTVCLSDHSYVLQPDIPYLKSNPFTVKNHALLRFLKALLISLEPGLKLRSLWPCQAACAVSITGDVHDYSGIPGREDREYRDMISNCDLLRELGLEGRAAWYCSAYVAARHPDTFREAFARGYEIQPHTYIETQYCLENWDYSKQSEDLERCYEAFEPTSGGKTIYRKGFRTHGYQSDLITREMLDDAGCEYLADLQAWESPENLPERAYRNGILYFGLPQQAYGRCHKPLRLMEIPDTVPNDHTLYRLFQLTPEQSFDFWKGRFDRVCRLGGYFQTCFHPYISLFEAPGRKEAYTELLRYMQSKGASFLLPVEVSRLFSQNTPGVHLF